MCGGIEHAPNGCVFCVCTCVNRGLFKQPSVAHCNVRAMQELALMSMGQTIVRGGSCGGGQE